MLQGQAPQCALHWTHLAEKVRKPAQARGHVAGTCSGDFLQRQFSSCDIPVFAKSSVAGTEL